MKREVLSEVLSAVLAGLVAWVPGVLVAENTARPDPGLMKELSNPDFKTRKQAQGSLAEWGRQNLDAGIEHFYSTYHEDKDPEVRRRSREILRELVILKQAGEGEGYMGIRMQAEQLMGQGGELRWVVRVTEVMDGTPAEKAGLKAQDLITGVDDLKFEGGEALNRFGEYIKSCKPRTDVTLHLLRTGREMDLKVNLMRRPRDLEQRTFLWGGEEYIPPPQEEVEEEEFQEWLQLQRRQRAKSK
jgi:hypothetical protein